METEEKTQQQQEEPRVRVMTEAERENYNGLTLDQTPTGTYDEQDIYGRTGANRDAYGRSGAGGFAGDNNIHVVFSHGDAKELRNAVLERLLGRHWKWKLAAIAGGLALAAFLVFVALPALAVLLVAGGLVFLLAQLFSF